MTPRVLLVVTLSVLLGCSAKLKRPDVPAARTLDPPLAEGASAPAPVSSDATPVRLVPTQARVGRRLLHQRPGDERVEDAVWSWSSTPDRYLDTALQLAAGADPDVRMVDRADAISLAATILSLSLRPDPGGRTLAATVEVRVVGPDRNIETRVLTAEEPVSNDLPGDAAAALARLMHRLASESLALVPEGS